jgi:dihydropteroate synthase
MLHFVPPSADHWKLRSRTIGFGQLPALMGILNVTPDSFSDGGRFFDAKAAVEHGLRLVTEGADMLDVGGESTRPGSAPVDLQEEIRRVVPVIEELRKKTAIPISVDTSKAEVARLAVEAGAEIVNDVTALTGDPAMIALAAATGCGVCAMHIQGTPRTMQEQPTYGDVVAEVHEYLRECRDTLLAAGIELERIALDPGIGFGKTTEHNLELLSNAARFRTLGCPVLIGHSRKRFIAGVIGHSSPDSYPAIADPTAGTIGVALSLARQGVQVLRVHDIAPVREALLLFQASGGFA